MKIIKLFITLYYPLSRWNSSFRVARGLLTVECYVCAVCSSILCGSRLLDVLYQCRLPTSYHVRLSHHGDHIDGFRRAVAYPTLVFRPASIGH